MTTRAEALRAALEATLNDGLAAHRRGDHATAETIYRGVLRRMPKHASALTLLGKLLTATGRVDEASAHLEQAVAIAPESGDALAALAHARFAHGDGRAALDLFDRAVALAPTDADTWSNRGNVLRALNRDRDAIASYDRALALNPAHTAALGNRANALTAERRLDAAAADYQDALRQTPDSVTLNWNYSHLLLLRGEFAEGWRRFEWRKRLTPPLGYRPFSQPLWTGQQPIAGKTLFLWSEQGLGDTIQFIRYANAARLAGAYVILSVQDPLAGLIRQSFPEIEVIGAGAVPARFDYHCPLMSLPLAFGTTPATIPASAGYLRADPRHWRDRLAGLAGLKVGLVWISGATARGTGHDPLADPRTIPVSALAPLAGVPDTGFVSLQKSLVPLDADAFRPPPGLTMLDQTSELRDFSDTAALIAALDLVISVDTSVAHLAGALGKPVWILTRFGSCWRWLEQGATSPWYDSARLFRQPAPGDWSSVMHDVRAALRDRTAAPKTCP